MSPSGAHSGSLPSSAGGIQLGNTGSGRSVATALSRLALSGLIYAKYVCMNAPARGVMTEIAPGCSESAP
jgi:hypothetical protein